MKKGASWFRSGGGGTVGRTGVDTVSSACRRSRPRLAPAGASARTPDASPRRPHPRPALAPVTRPSTCTDLRPLRRVRGAPVGQPRAQRRGRNPNPGAEKPFLICWSGSKRRGLPKPLRGLPGAGHLEGESLLSGTPGDPTNRVCHKL